MGCVTSTPKSSQYDDGIHSSSCETLFLWDIENVRTPVENHVLPPAHLVRCIKDRFVRGQGCVEHRSVCSVTPASLHAIERACPTFVDQVTPELTVVLASYRQPKIGADYALQRELSIFLERPTPHKKRVVLVTGDADFLEPVQRALRAGVDVVLIHYEATSSHVLVTVPPYASPPIAWSAFLAECSPSVPAPRLPYPANRRTYNTAPVLIQPLPPSRSHQGPPPPHIHVPLTNVAPRPSTNVSPRPSTNVSPRPSTNVSPRPSTYVAPRPSTYVAPRRIDIHRDDINRSDMPHWRQGQGEERQERGRERVAATHRSSRPPTCSPRRHKQRSSSASQSSASVSPSSAPASASASTSASASRSASSSPHLKKRGNPEWIAAPSLIAIGDEVIIPGEWSSTLKWK